jgi:hypothetical protein
LADKFIKITGLAINSQTDQYAGKDLALLGFEDSGGQLSESKVAASAFSDPTINDVVMAIGHPGITSTGLGGYVATAGRHLGWAKVAGGSVDSTNQFASSVPASQGTSGGPVFNTNGDLIDILSNGHWPSAARTTPSYLKVRQFFPVLIDGMYDDSVTEMVARSIVHAFLKNPPTMEAPVTMP